jgi:hypothetical protein
MSMNEKDNCLGCEFDITHELALTDKIMRTIGGYREDEDINPCPMCLRDTMLAVAALLHLEAARLYPETCKPHAGSKHLDEAFAKAACDRLQAVIEADVIRVAGQKH